MLTKLTGSEEITGFIQNHLMCAVYFTGPDCNLCDALKPKLLDLLTQRFDELVLAEVDCSTNPALAAQRRVFTVPTLIVYIDGKESHRKARGFSLNELAREIERPYSLLFE